MGKKRIMQLVMFNGAIVLINTLLFSDALLGLNMFAGSAFSVSLAWTVVLLSAAVFAVGNWKLLQKKETRILTKNIHTLSDCIAALNIAIQNGDVFDDDILKNIAQIKRFWRKQNTIKDILLQKFSADEMSYQKFSGVLQNVENAIGVNVRSILNKIAAFDMEEYEEMQRTGHQGDAFYAQKQAIFNEYITFVNNATKANDDILLKLDKMLLEISRYNSLEDGDVQKLPAIIEMDELIKNANLYK